MRGVRLIRQTYTFDQEPDGSIEVVRDELQEGRSKSGSQVLSEVRERLNRLWEDENEAVAATVHARRSEAHVPDFTSEGAMTVVPDFASEGAVQTPKAALHSADLITPKELPNEDSLQSGGSPRGVMDLEFLQQPQGLHDTPASKLDSSISDDVVLCSLKQKIYADGANSGCDLEGVGSIAYVVDSMNRMTTCVDVGDALSDVQIETPDLSSFFYGIRRHG